jgi:hypothetical protein
LAELTSVPWKRTLTLPVVRIGARRITCPPVLEMLAPPGPPLTSNSTFEATVIAPEASTF